MAHIYGASGEVEGKDLPCTKAYGPKEDIDEFVNETYEIQAAEELSAKEQIKNAASFELYISDKFSFLLAGGECLSRGVLDIDFIGANEKTAVDAGCTRFYQPPIVSDDDVLRH